MELKNNMNEFKKSLSVLVVEDSAVDERLLLSMLTEKNKDSVKVESVKSLKSAQEALDKQPFDVIILDLNLPDSQGEGTLNNITENYPSMPIVVNTGAYEHDLGLKTLSLGAQDFLVKSEYSANLLIKALHYAIERKRLEIQLSDIQSQLFQAEKMQVIGGLASGVAHEVKNPLATILYGVTFLEEHIKHDDERYDTVIKNIKEATIKANVIISDLLDFSSLTKLNICPESLSGILNKALSLTRHEFDKRKIVIKESEDTDIKVPVDKNRIEQVIVNLLLNSVFAMDKGGVLEASISKVNEDIKKQYQLDLNKKYARLCLEDNGCGIEEGKMSEVYDPFYTTRRAKGGIGLGLSVCRTIMENHEGIISIENRKEGGVRASLFFTI